MKHDFARGIRLFNARQYFEAHEALEAVWLVAAGKRKTFLHGLIQVAAAFHHHTRNNPAGFHSLLEKGDSKLAAFGAEFESIDLHDFRQQLQSWREPRHPTSLTQPPLPQIRFVNGPERG